MMRPTGYIPDPEGLIRTSFERFADRAGLGQDLPDSYVVWGLPRVMDQHATSSCTGHAFATSLAPTLGWLPSPAEIYRNGRAIDRVDPSIPLADIGARPNQVIRAINEFGVRPMAQGLYSDADERTINDEPKLGDLELAGYNLLVGDYQIFARGKPRGRQVRTAVAADKPVCAAIAGGTAAFQDYRGGLLPLLHGPLDHYVTIIGYERVNGVEYLYRIRNSWGVLWGEEGDCWVSEEGLDELGSLIVCDVRRVS